MDKYYKIPSHKIKQLIKSTIGCIASDKITVDGEKVRYMYREEPDNIYDSGWRFFSGKEDQEYTDNSENFSFYKINTIANYDSSIIPYINMEIGSVLEKDLDTDTFVLVNN